MHQQNAINQIRAKLIDLYGDYKIIIESLYRSPDLPQDKNFQILNDQTNELFCKSSHFLKPKQLIDQLSEQQVITYLPIISRLNDESKSILFELRKREVTFIASLKENKEFINRTVNQLFEKYSISRSHELQRSTQKVKQLNHEIQTMLETFDSRLSSRVGLCIYEKNEFINKYEELQKRFYNMKSKLTAELQISQSQVIQLSTELKQLEIKNSELLKSLELEYSEKISQIENENYDAVNELQKNSQGLRAELKETEDKHKAEVNRLKQKILEKTKESQMDFDKKITEKQKEFKLKLKELQKSQKSVETSLKQQFDQQKEANNQTLNSLRSLHASLSQQTKDSDQITAQKLESIQKAQDLRIEEKTRQLSELLQAQQEELRSKSNNNDDLAKSESKRNELLCQNLEKELIAVTKSYEEEQNKLESEVAFLIRTNNDLESQFSDQKSTSKPIQQQTYYQYTKAIIATISSTDNGASDDRFLSPEQMSSRFKRFDLISNQQQTELRDLKLKKKNELSSFKNEANDVLQQETLNINSLSDEIRTKLFRFDKLEEQIKEIEANNKIELKNGRSHLKSKIKIQEETILKCKEELQRLQIDEMNKVQLSLLQADHRKAIQDLKNQIKMIKNTQFEDLENTLKAELQAERYSNEKKIKEAQDQLDEVLEELSKVTHEFAEDCLNDQQKWTELRLEIANSNMKMINAFMDSNDN